MKIGFIGQGWIGKHYANDFEARGYEVVRYALEEVYINNKKAIADCDIVFVAVPTPTTPEGFSYEAVQEALKIVAPDSTVVIKSTLYPGTTKLLQEAFLELYVMHSPEFLREVSAAHDAAHPERNIIGLPDESDEYQKRAQAVLKVLPTAPYTTVMRSYEAELVKYAGNCFLFTKVLFMNILYDLLIQNGGDWGNFREALINDPRVGESHTQPIHRSGHDTSDKNEKRGAGGHCFIKDFEAFRQFSLDTLSEQTDVHDVLTSLAAYNVRLLQDSGKDIDLLTSVYGETLKP